MLFHLVLRSLNMDFPIDSMIIVCCHAIWLGGLTAGVDESEWLVNNILMAGIDNLHAGA